MTVRYFWDIDTVAAPSANEEKEVVDVMQKKFGDGKDFEIIGNKELHEVEPLRSVANFQHSDNRRQSYEMFEMKMVKADWDKDDKLVLISDDADFAELLGNMRKTGVQTIVVNREGRLNPALQQEATEIHSLDEFFH